MMHFLSLAQLSPAELTGLLKLAAELKDEWKAGGNGPLLADKSLAMVFQKPSLRTRVSFEMGMQQLGGHALYLVARRDQAWASVRASPMWRACSRAMWTASWRAFLRMRTW